MENLAKTIENTSGETKTALEGLTHALAESIKQNKILKQKLDYVVSDNWLLKKKIFGASSEKLSASQVPYQAECDIAYADETTLQVLKEKGRRAQTKSYIWCFISGPPNQRVITYQYHASRKADVANEFFEGYSGALHCDGYGGYHKLISSSEVVGLNCMAHARRKFVEALPSGKETGVSGYVVQTIRALYRIEDLLKIAKASYDEIKKFRQKKSKPILEELHIYLREKQAQVLTSGKLGEAINYMLKRWEYFITYLEDGRYEIDNNRAERAIKPFVMGRKAWLFSNSEAGADASARIFSLIETIKENDREPCACLEYIFQELPNCETVEDYENLLPWNIKDADLEKCNLSY